MIVANNDSKYLINKGDDEELVSSVAVSSRAGSSQRAQGYSRQDEDEGQSAQRSGRQPCA